MRRWLLDLPPRILDKIEPEPNSGCWLWTGAIGSGAYGNIQWHGRTWRAHRLVYQLLVGSIPKPTLNHDCRARSCVNPSHLTPMTMKENMMAEGSLCLGKAEAERSGCAEHGVPYRQYGRFRRCPKCVSGYNANYVQRRERAS